MVRTYTSYTEDFVETKNQQFHLPDSYRWIRGGGSHPLAYGVCFLVASVWCRCSLRLRVVDRASWPRDRRQGFFLYGNHTQPFGDVMAPILAGKSRRKYWIASAANLGIPVLGRLLPALGILPVPERAAQMRPFLEAVRTRISQGFGVVVYPEAHVWPWYTGIRPFPAVSFGYPLALHAPVYCTTMTYQRRRHGSRPRATLFVDGPFEGVGGTLREKKESLCAQVHACMERHAKESSTYAWVVYEPKERAV